MEFQSACQKCAECCSTQRIPVNLLDIFRISARLDISPDEFVVKYLELITDRDGEATYVIREMPCPFLKGSLCSIHKIKPIVCKITPCPKNQEYNEFKKKYGTMTLNFLANPKKDMLAHFISEEYTGFYLEKHEIFRQSTAEEYKEKIEKDLKNEILMRGILEDIIKLSVHPAFQAQVANQDG